MKISIVLPHLRLFNVNVVSLFWSKRYILSRCLCYIILIHCQMLTRARHVDSVQITKESRAEGHARCPCRSEG